MTPTQVANEVLNIAAAHLSKKDHPTHYTSAHAAYDDAVTTVHDLQRPDDAAKRALHSLGHSVGVFQANYRKAKALIASSDEKSVVANTLLQMLKSGLPVGDLYEAFVAAVVKLDGECGVADVAQVLAENALSVSEENVQAVVGAML